MPDPLPADPDLGAEKSPFLLHNEAEYQIWRLRKLAMRERLQATRLFEFDAGTDWTQALIDEVRQQVFAYNFVLFETAELLGKPEFLALNRRFGLQALDSNLGSDEDSVTSLEVVSDDDHRALYIPYTNRALKWHTDGYYNPHDRRINAFALYCLRQAGRGGGNYLFDHEYLYLLIRDQSPELMAALMSDDLMHIPANVQGNQVIRAEENGPVFSIVPGSCALNMRYTSRPQNIAWKSDQRSQRALNLIREILMDSDVAIELRLKEYQGLVCNNLLHGRQAFAETDDGVKRLVYRARYYDSINFDCEYELEAAS